MESMDEDGVGCWLFEQGFSKEVIDSFIGKLYKTFCCKQLLDQGMDGMAIIQTINSSSGPDCLKDVVQKFGSRVKVYTAIKNYLEEGKQVILLKCVYYYFYCKCVFYTGYH